MNFSISNTIMPFILWGTLCLLVSCSSKWSRLEKASVLSDEIRSVTRNTDCCKEWENYATYEELVDVIPTRYIRLNFHIVQDGNGEGNFTEDEGREYVYNMVSAANATLKENVKMNLPVGNETPVLLPHLQYVITPNGEKERDTGIYFHQEEELYYMIRKGKGRNIGDDRIIKKYRINPDTVINVFLLEHHKYSLAKSDFKIVPMGVAIRNSIKLLGMKTDAERGFPFWFNKQLLTHEVGHVLGLGHSWLRNDSCDDTPPHPNCWNVGAPPCEVCSNNVMDYNTFRNAWTPCQIGSVQRNLANIKSRQRKLLVKDWCAESSQEEIIISGNQEWKGARDLKGDIRVTTNSILHIRCRVALPNAAKIYLEPNSQLIISGKGYLHNDCGEQWDGIYFDKTKKRPTLQITPNSIRDCKHEMVLITNSASS